MQSRKAIRMAEGATAVEEATGQGEGHPSGDERFAVLDKALRRTRYDQDQLIELLHVAQDVFGCLGDDVLAYLARALRLPPSRVLGVATFYHLFVFEQPGEHVGSVCLGTACYVKGADAVLDALVEAYGTQPGETTPDGLLTIRTARCVGSCGLAPVVVLDGQVHSHATPESALARMRAATESDESAEATV